MAAISSIVGGPTLFGADAQDEILKIDPSTDSLKTYSREITFVLMGGQN